MIYKTLHDIPIKIYHRIIETGDYNLLVYDTLPESISKSINKESPEKHDIRELEEIFDSMMAYRLDKFGVSKEFKEMYYLEQDLIRCQIKYLDGDTSMGEKINRFESQIGFIAKQYDDKENDLEIIHARERRVVEKETSRDIDKISAFDFYIDLKDIQERYEKIELDRQVKNMKHA